MSMGIACSSRYFGKIGSWCTRSIRNTRSFCQHHLGMDILQLQEPWATEWFQSRWITAVVTTHSSGTRKATLAWGPCGGWKHGAGWYSDKTSDGHMFFPFLYWDCVELGLVVFFYNCRHAQKTVVMRVFVHIVHFGRLAHTHTHLGGLVMQNGKHCWVWCSLRNFTAKLGGLCWLQKEHLQWNVPSLAVDIW